MHQNVDARTVMIVDDHPDIREGIRILLEDSGYSAILAENGHAALRQLYRLNQSPSLILLDLMMPVMDGWQFLNELQRNTSFSKIPVVVTSGIGLDMDNFPSAIAYLRKPIQLPDLLPILQRTRPAASSRVGRDANPNKTGTAGVRSKQGLALGMKNMEEG